MIDKQIFKKVLFSPKTKKIGIRLLLAISAVGIFGFLVLPPVLKSFALEELGKALHRPVSIEKIRINPYALSVSLDDVKIKSPDGKEDFISFQNLYLNFESSALLRGGVVVGEMRLLNPRLRIVRLAQGRYNFSDLIDEFSAKPESGGSPTLFSLNNIRLQGGTIDFEDRLTHANHAVSDINLTLPFVSNMAYAANIFTEPSFSASVDGAPIQLQGKSKPFSSSQESELGLDMTGLQLFRYLDYLPLSLPIQIQSGTLNSAIRLKFRQGDDHSAALLISGNVTVNNLDLRDKSNSALFSFKRFELVLGTVDLFRKQLKVDRIALESPEVRVKINRYGELNWASLAAKDGGEKKSDTGKNSAETPSSLIWSCKEVEISGGRISVLDESRGEPFRSTIESIAAKLSLLDSRSDVLATLNTHFKVNRRGEVALDGMLTHSPLKLDAKVDIRTLDLLPLQPYFSEKLNIAITRGQLSANGRLRLNQGDAGKSDTDKLAAGFAGQLSLSDFRSVDKINSADFLRWKSLHLDKIDIQHNPDSIAIGEVALADFFARMIVSAQGKLNLMQIVRDDEAPGSAADAGVQTADEPSTVGKASMNIALEKPQDHPVLPVKIKKVTLQGGNVRFTDNFVKPNYTADLRQIGGRISGLSSEAGSSATLELRGSYDGVAPLNVTARINPLSAKPYLDLQADIKGVELTSFSSYSGKYAGYAIDKGKLSLFVKYKIENDQLQAENRVFLDQLTFGDAVDSPDATKLPVRLAVSLLKNRNGEIDLDLPISGSLNDPQFSVGGLIVKVIVNLLVKAVTSPFALIGSMFGNGEELSSVDFNAGRSVIDVTAEKRLATLAKALIERPALRLEIEGKVDPDPDREGLKRAAIDSRVRALKREDLIKRRHEGAGQETIDVDASEYPALLERAYRAESFPKPRNLVGMIKTLPVGEMEKLMLANMQIGEDDLRALGDLRAKAVRDWLVNHQVPAERLFLLPSRPVAVGESPETEKKPYGSRADFALK